MSHTCDAMIVTCIDFRFQKYLREWEDLELKDQTFDLLGFAGSTKELDIVLKEVEISVSLHSIKDLYLIHHEECGAYGEESTLERHTEDLRKAREVIGEKYPQLSIHLYYLHLDGEFEKIEYK